MISNLDHYTKDLDILIQNGDLLEDAMVYECFPEKCEKEIQGEIGENTASFIKSIPSFKLEYQIWYSETLALIKQLLPERYSDFISFYEKPKSRKEITSENYKIQDYLQGLSISQGIHSIVEPSAAFPQFQQQNSILKSVKKRFESSLFDIQKLVQADLFDSELDAAESLLKHKFTRAAGAVAGVVLEKHLDQVCANREVKMKKKEPTIADLNNELKKENAYDITTWRFIEHLGDIRNLCEHNKKIEPTTDQVADFINGVKKIIKTVF